MLSITYLAVKCKTYVLKNEKMFAKKEYMFEKTIDKQMFVRYNQFKTYVRIKFL